MKKTLLISLMAAAVAGVSCMPAAHALPLAAEAAIGVSGPQRLEVRYDHHRRYRERMVHRRHGRHFDRHRHHG